jgi:class 3 adenylate cyclase
VRLLVADGRLERPEEVKSWSVTIPQGVREVVGRRLDHLSDECNSVLTVASVIGREFGLDALERVADVTGDRLLEVLEEAVAARVLNEVPRAVGRYSFSHALIRETLYEELGTTRRVRLHRQIGEVLEKLHGDNLEPHLAELAYHFSESAQGGDVDKAIDYATRAGERATSLTAYEDAVGHYQTALQALDVKDKPDEVQRCELLLALGDGQWKAGDTSTARETFVQAADVARTVGGAERLTRAALGHGELYVAGTVDESLNSLLEEALRALGEEESALRARALARLAMGLYFSDSRERMAELSHQAVEMARRLGDPATLAYALRARAFSLAGPENTEARLATATEMARLAEEADDRQGAFFARYLRLYNLLALGDIQAVDEDIEASVRLAEEMRQPAYLWQAAVYPAMRALLEGRFQEGERLAQQALAVGQRAQEQNAAQMFGVQMFILRREQGGFGEADVAAAKGFAERYPAVPAWRCALAWLYTELGRESEARSEFEGLAGKGFADLPQDGNLPIAQGLLSEVCAFLGDPRRAAVLYELMLPSAGQAVVAGAVATCTGSASRYLGLLAATMSRWEDAARHFEDALEMNARMGARPYVAYAQQAYADMLLARDKPGDREKALELLAQALEAAQEMGMKALVEKALALKLQAQGIDTSAPQTSIDAVAAAVQNEQPDLPPKAVAPDGTVTILFTDIEGSTAMTERLGDQPWLELLRGHNAIVRKRVAAHEGFEVKAEGDGFMLAFQSARKALECAVDIQRAFADRNEDADEPIRVRIGLHTGEALKEADDFYGKNVILAARIAGQAQGGEVLVSSLLKELTESAVGVTFGEGREVELKGLAGQHRVFEVVW